MPKVLAQAGISLADVYDVEGSIAGTEQLISEEVSLVHDMGGQIFSERLQSFIINLDSGNVAQSTANTQTAGAIPDSPNRILGVTLIVNLAARLSNVNISLLDPGAPGNEFPIWSWDETADLEIPIQHDLAGAGVAAMFLLRPQGINNNVPTLVTRMGISNALPEFHMHLITNAFGAGSVRTEAYIYLARANEGNPPAGSPSSHGLPLPSW